MMNTANNKPFSQACENNKRPILAVLKRVLAHTKQVLEIGSGTGQHAVFFAEHLPHVQWHTSDQAEYHDGINAWLDDVSLNNVQRPMLFKVGREVFPSIDLDAVFTANTAHIMQENEVKQLMEMMSSQLPQGGVFCQYGPFKQGGKFSTNSNRAFHDSLIARGYGGYRDIDELTQWAPELVLDECIDMPANNHMLVWVKQ